MKHIIKISIITLLTSTLILTTSVSWAADLVAESATPVITFHDTSTDDGSDWLIAGFENRFLLNDRLGGNDTNVIFIDGAAGSTLNGNTLKVDSSGDINLADGSVFIDRSSDKMGVGTTIPEVSLHVKGANGNLILEGGSGVPYSTWELATLAFEGFWLKDKLNDTVPFRVDGNVPTNSIRIGTEGVGIGVEAPTAKLDVAGDIKATFNGPNTSSGLVELLKMSANNTTLEQFSDAGFSMENARAGFSWAFRTLENTGGFAASKQGTGAKEFEVRNPTTVASNVELHLANGASNVAGAWLDASSRSLKKNIHDLSGDDAMQALRELKSVKYQYKSDQNNTQMVGFIAEDVPELLATHSRKALSSMKIVAVLTKALQVQDKSLQETKADMKAKDAKIAGMEAKIAKLILMQESLAKTLQARFTPFAAESLKANQQVTALDRE